MRDVAPGPQGGERLAAYGGDALVGDPDCWPRWPRFGDDTLGSLEAVMRSGRWSISGSWTGTINQERLFASRFAEYNAAGYCVPTANGTGALTIALSALGVGAGDEVIVPGLTWCAPALAVLRVNAVPVLADVDIRTLCMDVSDVERLVTPRTRAIIAVHLYCSMVDMDALCELGARFDIAIIEDVAQSHGSMWHEHRAGTLGAIGVFSMHQGKPLTSGEGGAAITNDAQLRTRMEQLRANGRVYPANPPAMGCFDLIEVGDVLGENLALSEFHAALLIDALPRLDHENQLRQRNATILDACMLEIPGVSPIERPASVTAQTYYHYAVRLNRKYFADVNIELLAEALTAELGFPVLLTYPPLNNNTLYRPDRTRRTELNAEYRMAIDPRRYSLPNASDIHANCVIFHHSILLADPKAMETIASAFAKVQRCANHLRPPS